MATSWDGHGTFRLVRAVEQPSLCMSFAPWERFEARLAWKSDAGFRERIVRAHTTEGTPSVFEHVTTLE